jgi:hypothetical protein
MNGMRITAALGILGLALLAGDAVQGKPGGGLGSWPSMDEISDELQLTEDQRDVFEPALDDLRAEVGDRERPDGRRPGRGGDRAPRGGRGMRGGGGRGHGGGKGGCGHGGRGGGDCGSGRAGAGPGPRDGERPLYSFLETVVPTLEPQQVERMADLVVEQREQRRAMGRGGPDGRGSGRDLGPGTHYGALLGRAAEDLDLSWDQRKAARVALESAGDDLGDLRESFEEGSLSAEQLRDDARERRLALEKELQDILTAEQWTGWTGMRDEWREERNENAPYGRQEAMEPRAELLGKVLQLDDKQMDVVRTAFQRAVQKRHEDRAAFRKGEIGPEEAFYREYKQREETTAAIATALDDDQARVFAALDRMIPGGPRRR